ncbi:MAG TPA: hypothetical protein VEB21_08235, partial [Terriglobales bacterium]|nr:hypothetical protein [Terriglobales bacterium]
MKAPSRCSARSASALGLRHGGPAALCRAQLQLPRSTERSYTCRALTERSYSCRALTERSYSCRALTERSYSCRALTER